MKMTLRKHYLLLVVLLLIYSIVLIYALAYPPNPNRIIETWLLTLLLQRFYPRLWRGLMWFSAITILLYHPTAALYGRPSFGIVASLLSTTASEASEYIGAISWRTYIATLVLASVPLLIVRLSRNIAAPCWGRYWGLLIVLILVVMTAQTARKGYTTGGFPLRVQPIEFLADAYLQPQAYFAELAKIKADLAKPDNWHISSSHQNYRNYVLIIGESVRADYMHLYGFKYANTPFLDKHANIIMDKMLSAGPNTPISLLHGLTLSHGKPFSIQNNVITLAKKAGMDTAWLSNQGALGQYDTSISTIAYQANHVTFLKTTGYDFGERSFDYQLIAPLQKVLAQPLDSSKSRLIVLHIMGSHPNPCDRLPQPPHPYVENNNSNCYIDSIRQTDSLLHQIYTALKSSDQSFSMMYFSDHGLSHDKNSYEKNSIVRSSSILRHNDHYYQNYHVPLVVINSGQTGQSRNTAQRSGLELLDGIAKWLGIQTPQLPYGEQFFSPTPSQDAQILDFNQHLQPANQLQSDPLPANLR
ncbi:MAG: sulfatase-like hydrolase/transferase [Snodgrassella sp.]|uniref:phosphoethanolamine transferase n=1 Tax=Snodgrassella sp. TaxID=2815304 RepID=UPI00258EFAC7|nr:phosphoethanolamine transferase [Snodgrassella sp.]MCO6506173.1 sulfatase-like hydrolase/transferase [Snodgrassella sp.]MCO6513159.1 sulfatase-like hydrolase/transferase [Snodgrassella sp.]MCO6518855.1 sulfatase-like hydrolase/transferase [Snodgrassella sp.]